MCCIYCPCEEYIIIGQNSVGDKLLVKCIKCHKNYIL